MEALTQQQQNYRAGASAVGGIGSAMSAFAGLAAARSQAEMLKTQAAMREEQAKFNNYLLDLQKDDLNAQADEGAAQRGLDTAKVIGSQKASLAGSNIALDSDLALELEASERELSSKDVKAIKANAYKQSMGIEMQQMQNTFGARSGKIEASAKAAQTMATGGAQFASDIMKTGNRMNKAIDPFRDAKNRQPFD